MKKIHANIISENKIFEAEVSFNDKIENIHFINNSENPKLDYLIPGFIDLHIHGGGGSDIMDSTDPSIILRTHAKNGTTSLLLTTVTAAHIDLVKTFSKIENKKKKKEKGEAVILGIHLEGPYINKEKLGAQPQFTRFYSQKEIDELISISEIKVMTLAPELMKQIDLKELIKQKIIIQIGHTSGSYEDGKKALDDGAKSFTHLFNAMSGFHHRNPGIAGAALAHAEYSELIPDLQHVHPGAIKVALRSIPKLYFVTDATSATGMPDGQYTLGTHSVTKCSNGVRLADGTLAGSSLTMIEALKNLTGQSVGLSLPEASFRLSTLQSELLGISHERGSIAINKFADLILVNRNLDIQKVFIEGEEA